jgi:hypothetical protein
MGRLALTGRRGYLLSSGARLRSPPLDASGATDPLAQPQLWDTRHWCGIAEGAGRPGHDRPPPLRPRGPAAGVRPAGRHHGCWHTAHCWRHPCRDGNQADSRSLRHSLQKNSFKPQERKPPTLSLPHRHRRSGLPGQPRSMAASSGGGEKGSVQKPAELTPAAKTGMRRCGGRGCNGGRLRGATWRPACAPDCGRAPIGASAVTYTPPRRVASPAQPPNAPLHAPRAPPRRLTGGGRAPRPAAPARGQGVMHRAAAGGRHQCHDDPGPR